MLENVDNSILQFTPKGSYYNTQDQQQKSISETWNNFLNYDRFLFSLTMLLNCTAYSKGRMSHLLLSNPVKQSKSNQYELIEYGLGFDYESEIILHNLRKESMARALKNLLMLTKKEFKRVNNSKTRKIILRFIFQRDNSSLEEMCIKFKKKLKVLIRHALGKDLYNYVYVNFENNKYSILHKKYSILQKYNKDYRIFINFLFKKSDMYYPDFVTRFEKITDLKSCLFRLKSTAN